MDVSIVMLGALHLSRSREFARSFHTEDPSTEKLREQYKLQLRLPIGKVGKQEMTEKEVTTAEVPGFLTIKVDLGH